VVGDNVMLAMATSDQLAGPIKLLFPRPETDFFTEAGTFPFQLLGLGDVALPGLLACLALRYDASRSETRLRGRCALQLTKLFLIGIFK
jgi:minor histocompatibility antigen H13